MDEPLSLGGTGPDETCRNCCRAAGGGRPARLEACRIPTELLVLRRLAQEDGGAVSEETLVRHLGRCGREVSEGDIKRDIARLRAKLHHGKIRTTGKGYTVELRPDSK